MKYTEKFNKLKEDVAYRITSQADSHIHKWRPGEELTSSAGNYESEPGHTHKIDEEKMLALTADEHFHKLL